MVLLKIKDSDEITMHCNDGQLRAGKGIQGNYIDANSELEKKDVKKLTKVA